MNPLILHAAQELGPHVGIARSCRVLGLNRSSYYRPHKAPDLPAVQQAAAVPPVASSLPAVADPVQTVLPAPAPCSSIINSGTSIECGPSADIHLASVPKAPLVTPDNTLINAATAPLVVKIPRGSVPGRKLSPAERQHVLDILHSERFADKTVVEVYHDLLSEKVFLCSPSTMYRLLRSKGEVRERRNQRTHPVYTKPELLATGPNQVWTWDITKLHGPGKWTYFYLYVIMDIYSRSVVGWMVSYRESADLAKILIDSTCSKQGISPEQLTIHADRGSAMTSKLVANLLDDLGVKKTHSRPHVSNDNPFSEAQFKTLKYRPDFPAKFLSMPEAREFCQAFFRWYNTEHYHSGIAHLRPEDVHYGRAAEVIQARQTVLDTAYAAHPKRFVRKPPQAEHLDQAVWINPPTPAAESETLRKELLA